MRLSIFTLLFAIISIFSSAYAADRYEFDKSHTRILFYVNHLGFSDMIGEFTDYDGYFTFDPKNPNDSSVDVTIKPTGIRTSSSDLDKKLQDDEFFKSEEFPTIRFIGKGVKVTGKNTGEIHGDLTMLGITKPAFITVHFNKADYHPLTKDFVAGFSASAKVNRSEFGMTSYIPMVGDEVRLEVQTEGIDIDRKKLEAIRHK